MVFKKLNLCVKELRKERKKRKQVDRRQLSIIHANRERRERERSNRSKKLTYYPKILWQILVSSSIKPLPGQLTSSKMSN